MKFNLYQDILFLLFAFLLSFFSFGQIPSGEISGRVINKDRKLLAQALVFLENTGKSAYTDEKGEFKISDIEPGKYELVVSFEDQQTFRQDIELKAGEKKNLAIDLNENVMELKVIEIQSSRLNEITRLPDRDETFIYAGKKNEVIAVQSLNANLASNNTRQVFGKIPGLSVWENDGSGVQVGIATRGLSPNRSWEFNVRQNGYDVSADVYGYPEAYYNPPMEAVERIQLVRGAASLQFGPQFGGLLNYQLKKGDAYRPFTFETQTTVGSFGMMSFFNGAGGTAGKWNYYAYLHHRNGDGWRENAQFQINHFHSQVSYRFNTKLNLGLELTGMHYQNQQPGGLTDVQFASDPQQSTRERNWFEVPWVIPVLKLNYEINEKSRLQLRLFALRGERNSIGFVRAANVADSISPALANYQPRQIDRDFYENLGAELRFLTEYSFFNQKAALVSGIRFYKAHTRRKQLGTGNSGSDFDLRLQNDFFPRALDYHTNNFSFFTENTFYWGEKFSFTPGIRLEWIELLAGGRLNTDATGNEFYLPSGINRRTVLLLGAGLEYKINENTGLYANFSEAFRPIQFADLTPPATTDVIDPNLQEVNGFNLDMGYRGIIKEILNFDVSVFMISYDNRIGTIAQLDENNRLFNLRANLGRSQNKGVESYLELQLLNMGKTTNRKIQLSVFSSLAFIDALYLDLRTTFVSGSGASAQISENNLKNKRVENSPEFIGRAGLNFVFRSFSSTLQWNRTSRAFADANNTILPNPSATIGLIPSYEVWDWSFSMILKNYNLRGGVNNLFNHMYFTRRAGGYPGPGLIPADGRTWYFSFGAKF